MSEDGAEAHRDMFTLAPIDFLINFDKACALIDSLIQQIESLVEEGIKVNRYTPDVLEPTEKASIERIRNLMILLDYSERGEEDTIMLTAIHELKWIFNLIDHRRPCPICGEVYYPVKYMVWYECDRCKYRIPEEPMVFYTYVEAKNWLSRMLRREKMKGRRAIFCPKCIDREIVVDGVKKRYPHPMNPKVKIEVNQYIAYPQYYLLIDLVCKNCGRAIYTGYIQVYKEGEEVAFLTDEDRRYYESIARVDKCGYCGGRVEMKTKLRPPEEIDELTRYKYNLPFIKKGDPVDPPKESGVTSRVKYRFYRLHEPHVVDKIHLEFTLRNEIFNLLNDLERYRYDRDICARCLDRLDAIISSLESNIIADRTYLNAPPTTVIIDKARLGEIVSQGRELSGLLEIILKAYMVRFMQEHGDVVQRYFREFKKGMDYLAIIYGRSNPKDNAVEVTASTFAEVMNMIISNLPALKGLVIGIRNWILDKERITQRDYELIREHMKALREMGVGAMEGRPLPIRDRVLSILYTAPEPMTLDEIAEKLGLTTDREIARLRGILGMLARRGYIRKFEDGRYGVTE